MSQFLQSSNPVLQNAAAANPFAYRDPAATRLAATSVTVQGVVNKTAILVLIAAIGGAGGYWLMGQFPGAIWVSSVAALVVGLGIGFVLFRKPQIAVWLAPIYALVEGVFLGAFTALADYILVQKGLEAALGGVGVQAFVITMACAASMLGLYTTGIIKPTARFRAVIFTLTGAVMLAYLISWPLALFGLHVPLIGFASAVNDTGMMGFLGLGINVLILGLASLMLIIDFERVEQSVAAGQPKYMEWYLGFGLLVTLAWIYYEAVKLTLRLAVLFGGRD